MDKLAAHTASAIAAKRYQLARTPQGSAPEFYLHERRVAELGKLIDWMFELAIAGDAEAEAWLVADGLVPA